MYGVYNPDRTIHTTTVPGTSWTGLYATDGSVNIVLDSTGFGPYHKCGALRVSSSTSTNLIYDPSGAYYSNHIWGFSAGVAAPVNWTPLNDPSLVAWWDAALVSSLSLSGSNILSWTDRKSSIVASQAVGANQPLYTSSLVQITGNAFLQMSGLPSAYDLIMMASPSASVTFRTFLWSSSGNQFLLNSGASTLGLFDGAFKQAGSLTWTAAAILYMNVASGTSISMGLNGVTPLSPVTTPTMATTSLAQFGNVGQGFGPFGDVILTAPNASLSLQNKYTGFLAWKYSLQANLPVGHPYLSRAPLTSDP